MASDPAFWCLPLFLATKNPAFWWDTAAGRYPERWHGAGAEHHGGLRGIARRPGAQGAALRR